MCAARLGIPRSTRVGRARSPTLHVVGRSSHTAALSALSETATRTDPQLHLSTFYASSHLLVIFSDSRGTRGAAGGRGGGIAAPRFTHQYGL